MIYLGHLSLIKLLKFVGLGLGRSIWQLIPKFLEKSSFSLIISVFVYVCECLCFCVCAWKFNYHYERFLEVHSAYYLIFMSNNKNIIIHFIHTPTQ